MGSRLLCLTLLWEPSKIKNSNGDEKTEFTPEEGKLSCVRSGSIEDLLVGDVGDIS